jgi:aspartyl-tRNA(Asn)/glutamyl-tRNA(Gln) amidotransferase subunit C
VSDGTARISADEVAAVARLAHLQLRDDEVERFTHQLADVLDHAADIEALDLTDVEPMARPVRVVNVLRPDDPAPGLDRDEVLAQAPAAEDGQFRVPPVLGGTP